MSQPLPPSLPRRGAMHRLWFQGALPWLIVRGFLGRVTVTGQERIPACGPVVFVGLHRAGLVDGWVHAHALPRRTVFLVAAARQRPLLRLLVAGIPVARRQDGGDAGRGQALNRAALDECRAELAAGRTVFVFPEGTSSLGPRHLPFQPGAALLARSCPEAVVVPLAIHYVSPAQVGTAVEIVVGQPFRMPPGETPAGAQAAVTAALEAVAVEFPDRAAQLRAEAAARAAWRAGGSYAAALRAPLDGGCLPGPGRWSGLRGLVGVTSAFLNAPVILAQALAGRWLADGDNVVLLWKVLVGLPAQIVWSAGFMLTMSLYGCPALAAAYALLMALRLALPAGQGGHFGSLSLRAWAAKWTKAGVREAASAEPDRSEAGFRAARGGPGACGLPHPGLGPLRGPSPEGEGAGSVLESHAIAQPAAGGRHA